MNVLKNPEFHKLPGWFDYPHVYDFLIDNIPDGGRFVELGTYMGKSIIYFSSRVHELRRKIDIWSVDYYRRPEVRSNLTKFNVNANLMVGDSRSIKIPGVYCAFIDASHEYQDVVQDIKNWMRQIKPGGIIAGHDYLMSGVKQAVDELLPGHQTIPATQPLPCGPCWWYRLN
jgi:predicted O-methyltransferase YrrM